MELSLLKKIGSIITVLVVWFTSIAIFTGSIVGIYYTLEAKGLFEKEFSEILAMIPAGKSMKKQITK